ncbi:hypothetical protein ABB37_02632 [Leptomonas pyrrhocoris]|uniref:Uncharacterized protein n=1 Tax=Leptomonas pyrrhocoris TaxID=157538 RepID=A0A0N0DXD8_LEPPY|nr:hypothetical protein ABB37_02632 [Leptomonas pyrrhocoris]KPA82868.1 hypothetical protein ABB37_02632 [Leptomonas pyrrhocoris]|eukprot:XP_015661307.1 hypothetical protein ABB37_02632 [Leptomonas pyrrhocoris]
MLKRFPIQPSGKGALTLLRRSAAPSTANLLHSPHGTRSLTLRALTSAPLLRCRVPLLRRCCTAVTTTTTAMTTASAILTQPCRTISFSYATAVPCVRFDVSTKVLARITNQPTLPPSANIYVIDVRKKHNKTKKPNPRRIMSKVIAAHRAEKTKAAVEMDADDAYTPPLIFLVKTDDTTKQAAHRQHVMDEQLTSLGEFGEFRVCVLSGPKSRHWSQYVASEEKDGESSTAATQPPPLPSLANPSEAAAAGAVAAAQLSPNTGKTTSSAPASSLNSEGTVIAAASSAAVHVEGEGVDAAANDGTAGDEEEWEEVEEEVEEDEDEMEVGVPEVQPRQDEVVDESGKDADAIESPSLDEVDDVTAAHASVPVEGTPSSSSSSLRSSNDARVRYEDEHFVDDGAGASAHLYRHNIPESTTLKGGGTHDVIMDAHEEGHATAAAEEDEDEDVEAIAGVDEHTETPPATAAKTEVTAPSSSPSSSPSPPPAQPAEEEKAWEEFDIDGLPIAEEATGTTPNVARSPREASSASLAEPAVPAAAEVAEPSSPAAEDHALHKALKVEEEMELSCTPSTEAAGEVDKVAEANSVEAAAEVMDTAPVGSIEPAKTESPPESPSALPPPPPQPTTPMPVYPHVAARLYNGASTAYLSDRALRDLPLKGNVLVIDRLDWHDGTIADIDAALAQTDPVAGHVLLYRDAYAPQLACVVKENIVFRDALVPFIFAFRTSLSRAAAQTQQRRFVEALRCRPHGLSVEQQALVAGQKDRTFVCVLCAEESVKGGENPLENPDQRSRVAAPKHKQQDARTATSSDTHEEEEEELNDADVRETEEAADAALDPDSTDALQRLWSMIDDAPASSSSADADAHGSPHSTGGSVNRDLNDQPSRSSLTSAKKKFSVPVPSYEMEEEGLADYGGGDDGGYGGSASAFGRSAAKSDEDDGDAPVVRRGINARSSSARPRDSSSTPPTSLPSKPAPAPMSLGLLGFETVVFGRPNAYAHMHTPYDHGEQHRERGRERRSTAHATKTHSTEDMNHDEEDGHGSVHGAVDHSVVDAATHEADGGSALTFAAASDLDAPETKGATSESKKPRSYSSRRIKRSISTRRWSGEKQKSKAARKNDDAAAAAAAAAQAQAEDAAIEDFILRLYEDNDKKSAKTAKRKKASAATSRRSGGGGASAVPSARSLLKSAGRKKKKT